MITVMQSACQCGWLGAYKPAQWPPEVILRSSRDTSGPGYKNVVVLHVACTSRSSVYWSSIFRIIKRTTAAKISQYFYTKHTQKMCAYSKKHSPALGNLLFGFYIHFIFHNIYMYYRILIKTPSANNDILAPCLYQFIMYDTFLGLGCRK